MAGETGGTEGNAGELGFCHQAINLQGLLLLKCQETPSRGSLCEPQGCESDPMQACSITGRDGPSSLPHHTPPPASTGPTVKRGEREDCNTPDWTLCTAGSLLLGLECQGVGRRAQGHFSRQGLLCTDLSGNPFRSWPRFRTVLSPCVLDWSEP